jgi:hypothetical protein
MPITFKGNQLIQPQAAVFVDDSVLSGQTHNGSGDLILVGPAQGGAPNVPLYFVTPNDAKIALRGGNGMRAIQRAFQPGPEAVGAPRVAFIRAGSASQSTVTLTDSNSNPSLVLTSQDYGSWNNLIRVNVSAGSTVGRKVQVQYGTTTAVLDNVQRPSFSFTYSGASTTLSYGVGALSTNVNNATTTSASSIATATSLTVTLGSVLQSGGIVTPFKVLVGYPGSAAAEVVTVTAVATNTLTVSALANAHASGEPVILYTGEQGMSFYAATAGVVNAADSFQLPFSLYTTIQDMVNYIAAHTHYAATMLSPLPTDPSSSLDGLPSGTNGLTGPVTVNSNLYGVMLALNSGQQSYVTATLATNATQPPAISGSSNTWTYLAGGSDGSIVPTSTDWTNALQAATAIDCSVIAVATGDATIHAMLQAHVDFMSTMQQARERVAIVGGVAGETTTQAIARANNLRDPRFGLVYPGIVDTDITLSSSAPVTLDPWLVAAQLGGMFCGLGIREALTNKYISASGLEVFLSQSDQQTLLLSGIIPLVYQVNKGYRVLHSISTWTADTNFRRNELSTMRSSDFLVKTVRTAANSLIGQIVDPQLLSRVKSVVSSSLQGLWDNGVIVGDAFNPAYRKVAVSGAGDTVNVQFEVSIAIPANYILITASLQPYVGTAA